MIVEIKRTLKGRYRLTAVGSDGEEKRSTPWFDNLITDNGLDLLNDGGYLTACAAGADNTPPAITDTQLGSLLGSTTSVTRSEGRQIAETPYYVYQIASFLFSQGAVVGNVAEIGVGATATDLFSRALVRDGGGNPTVISVLADEFLRVDYELRIQIPDVDTSGTFDIGGTTHTWTGRAAEIGSDWNITDSGPAFSVRSQELSTRGYSGSIGAIDGVPTGSVSNPTNVSVTPYASGDFQSSAAFVWGPGAANFPGGVGALSTQGINGDGFYYQVGFSPKIPKTNTDQLTITFTHSWGRA